MGWFIVIEGLDGAGTTTQCGRLHRWLQSMGRRAHRTCEPSDGPVGRLIRDTLARRPGAPAPWTLPWMFAADRADHLAREIEPALAEGDVVSDRYYASSLAYQSLQLPLERVRALNEGFRVPDLTLFVEVPVQVALTRMAGRGGEPELFERRDHLERIARQYEEVMRHLEQAGEPVVWIDGAGDVDAVERACKAAVRARLGA